MFGSFGSSGRNSQWQFRAGEGAVHRLVQSSILAEEGRTSTLGTHAYGFAEPHERLDALSRAADDILRWTPFPLLAKHRNGGAAKPKDRLFLTAFKRFIERMRLNNSSNRQRSNLHKSEASEMVSAQNVYAPLVAEKDIVLAP
jgi:hypothetical protein